MIILNNIAWYVMFVEPNHPMLRRSDGTYSIGSCDVKYHVICINKYLPNNLIKKVLSHEITHAAMFSYNINIDIKQEELIADFISNYGEKIVYATNFLFNAMRERFV